MCRYGFHTYKRHLACFSCRKVFRRDFNQPDRSASFVCSECGGKLLSIGRDFKAPKQSNVKQWRIAHILAQNGVRFDSCGCGGPGYRPATMRELPEFLREHAA